MRERISGTARYGGITRGPRVVGADARVEMHRILAEIQSRFEIGDHVVHRNRPCERVDPSRANHDGEPFDERANHLEREATRANPDRGAKLDHRDA